MSIKVLAKGMMKEYQIDYDTAKKVYEVRAIRPFLTPRDFKRGENILKKIIGGNNGNHNHNNRLQENSRGQVRANQTA
jgi:hypothetical protein